MRSGTSTDRECDSLEVGVDNFSNFLIELIEMYEIRIVANFLGSAADVFRTAIDTPYLTARVRGIITKLSSQLEGCSSIDDLKKIVIDFIKEALIIYEKLPLDDQEQHYDLSVSYTHLTLPTTERV